MAAIAAMLKRMFGGVNEIRGLMLGLDASGRTTFLYKLVLGEVVTTIPTIGFNVETVKQGEVSFTLWDVGGCDKIRPLWRHYYQNTQVVFMFVDSNDRERMDEVKWSLELVTREDELRDCALIVVCNKQDLPRAMTPVEIEDRLGLASLRNREWTCLPCSASKGDGIAEIMHWAEQACLRLSKAAKATPAPAAAPQPTPEEKQAALLNKWLEQEDEPDDEFLEKLLTFKLESWDHRTHLRIAWVYLKKFGRKEGMKRIFEGIKNFIAQSGKAKSTAFHETLTYFWVHIVHYCIEATKNPTNSFKGFLVMNPQVSNAVMWEEYYTRQHMMNNPDARKEVVLPDKHPLPSLLSKTDGAASATENLPKKAAVSEDEFLSLFEARKLPGWSHAIYLHVIHAYLVKLGRREAVKKIMQELEAFQKGGYHCTVTYFWIQMIDLTIAGVIDQTKQPPATVTFATVMSSNSDLNNSELYLKYYKKDTINSDKAAKELVLPDLKPLPSVVQKK